MATTPHIEAFDKYDARGAYHWSEVDPSTRAFNPPLVARYRLVADAVVAFESGGDVLDIGCGDGYLLSLLAPHVHTAHGIDSEPAGIEAARAKLASSPNVQVAQGDCYRLPFDENQFQHVTLTDVIEHLVDPDVCLEEIGRVLAPSGRLILTTPKWRSDRMWDERHVQEFRPAELRRLLERHFQSVELSYFWPSSWSNFYATRIGWRLTKKIGRVVNPFLRGGTKPEGFGQIMAVCTK